MISWRSRQSQRSVSHRIFFRRTFTLRRTNLSIEMVSLFDLSWWLALLWEFFCDLRQQNAFRIGKNLPFWLWTKSDLLPPGSVYFRRHHGNAPPSSCHVRIFSLCIYGRPDTLCLYKQDAQLAVLNTILKPIQRLAEDSLSTHTYSISN